MSAARVALLAAGVVLAASPAAAQEPAERGRAVFEYWCAPCHDSGPGNPGTIALEVRYQGTKPAVLEARTDLTPELTEQFVRTGISIMPPFRKTEITDAELRALAAYLAPRGE